MCPLWALVIIECLHFGGLCSGESLTLYAFVQAQLTSISNSPFYLASYVGQSLTVDYGDSVVLPCDGSAFAGEEGTFHWETMGTDVAFLQEGEQKIGPHFEVRDFLFFFLHFKIKQPLFEVAMSRMCSHNLPGSHPAALRGGDQ